MESKVIALFRKLGPTLSGWGLPVDDALAKVEAIARTEREERQ